MLGVCYPAATGEIGKISDRAEKFPLAFPPEAVPLEDHRTFRNPLRFPFCAHFFPYRRLSNADGTHIRRDESCVRRRSRRVLSRPLENFWLVVATHTYHWYIIDESGDSVVSIEPLPKRH